VLDIADVVQIRHSNRLLGEFLRRSRGASSRCISAGGRKQHRVSCSTSVAERTTGGSSGTGATNGDDVDGPVRKLPSRSDRFASEWPERIDSDRARGVLWAANQMVAQALDPAC
jgi:hypothetical protein